MLLPWLILIPFIGGFLCWQTERFGVKVPRWIALVTMGLTLALSLQLWLQGGYSLTQSAGIPQWQSEFDMPWIPRFGISIHLAIDGLSLLMVVLTGLLGVLAVLCSWKEIEKYQGFFHLNLMWILGGVIGVFLAIDMFLFFFFWEMMLVPMYFLIALWGIKPLTVKRVSRRQPSSSFTPGEWSGDVDRHPGAGFRSLQCDRRLDLQL